MKGQKHHPEASSSRKKTIAQRVSKKSSQRSVRILWITDPWETLDHPRDTTLRLIEEAHRQGLEQYWSSFRSIRLERNQIWLDASPILGVGKSRSETDFQMGRTQSLTPSSFQSIHYRPDPPIDLSYIHPLQLLHAGLRGHAQTELINPASILFGMNEKFGALAGKAWMPPTVVSSQWEVLLRFGQSEGKTVLKPIHEAQSHGIHLLDWRSARQIQKARKQIEEASLGLSRPILLQRYLPQIEQGETRVWMVDGELLASVKKLPMRGDFRVNIDRGSSIIPTQLTSSQKRLVVELGKFLRSSGIRLVALDLIDRWVTDFNISSPGLLTSMETILGRNLALPVISKLYPKTFPHRD